MRFEHEKRLAAGSNDRAGWKLGGADMRAILESANLRVLSRALLCMGRIATECVFEVLADKLTIRALSASQYV